MAAFAFKAVNARGKNTNGVLEGDNARQVRQQLREKGLIPLEVEQVAERAQSEGKGLSFSSKPESLESLSPIFLL